MPGSEGEIQNRVQEILHGTTLVDSKEINVEVSGATVILTGEVDSALEKRRARQFAEDVPGVEKVDDRMTVRGFVRRPDNELAEEVRHRLVRDPYVEGARIEVYASRGEIRLDGSVPTYQVRKAAEDVAWWTPGVIGVENLLLVTDEEFVDTEAPPYTIGA